MYRFFEIPGLLPAFLNKNIETLDKDELYKSMKVIVMYMKVINDIAECGAALNIQTERNQHLFYKLLIKKTHPVTLMVLKMTIIINILAILIHIRHL